MLRSEEMQKFLIYLPANSCRQILNILCTNKVAQLIPTGQNDYFSQEIRVIEKERSKLKYIFAEFEKFNLKPQENQLDKPADLEKLYLRLISLKEIEQETEKNILKLTEDLNGLKLMKDEDLIAFTGSLDSEKSFLFEKIIYESFKRNLIMKNSDIFYTTNEADLCKKNKKIYFILMHEKEVLERLSKIFTSLGGRILGLDERQKNREKNVLKCSSLLTQMQNIYVSNKNNLSNLLQTHLSSFSQLNHQNYKEFVIYSNLSNCYFSNKSFISICYVPARQLFKFKKVINYINQECAVAIEEIKLGKEISINDMKNKAVELKLEENNLNDDLIYATHKVSESEAVSRKIYTSSKLSSEDSISVVPPDKCVRTTIPINEEYNDSLIQKRDPCENKEEENFSMSEKGNWNQNSRLNSQINPKKQNRITSTKLEDENIIPTFYYTNRVTQIFQDLTNTFEVPCYNEINPGIFSLFTFPFLFGMMFSDLLHGLILIAIGLLLINNSKFREKVESFELGKMVSQAKYLLIFMGVGASYFGLLFNDFGGVHFNLLKTEIPYFGISYKLHGDAKTEFVNKLKMKMSIIIGFFHMLLGIIISYPNKTDNLTSLTASLLAYLSFVGYLVFLIFFKWLNKPILQKNSSLINELVEMYTKPFDQKVLFPFQKEVQLFLIFTLFISLTVLLVNKPLKNITNMDLWVEQGIHAIEFGVGLISNSASYLRLWAVSLAHSTLTEILHQSTFGKSIFLGVVLFPLYFIGTLSLLIALEGTSATLHGLRLNWIEFSGKFMKGKGVYYEPTSFDIKEE